MAWAGQRKAGSGIDFVVANLLEPPTTWAGAFDFVLEVSTLQSLPSEQRFAAMARIAAFLNPEGELLVICAGREEDEPGHEGPPWPLTRSQLATFTEAGLEEITFEDIHYESRGQPHRHFRVLYRQPPSRTRLQ